MPSHTRLQQTILSRMSGSQRIPERFWLMCCINACMIAIVPSSRIASIKSDFFWATSIPERRLRGSQPKVIRGDQSKRFFLTLNWMMAMEQKKKTFSQSQKAKHGLSCFLSSRCYVSWSWLPVFFPLPFRSFFNRINCCRVRFVDAVSIFPPPPWWKYSFHWGVLSFAF